MIGKLQYIVHSIPDIALAIGIVSRFSANLKENHLMAIKRIMIYLKGTEEYGLYYKKNGKFELRAYTDMLTGLEILMIERAPMEENSS